MIFSHVPLFLGSLVLPEMHGQLLSRLSHGKLAYTPFCPRSRAWCILNIHDQDARQYTRLSARSAKCQTHDQPIGTTTVRDLVCSKASETCRNTVSQDRQSTKLCVALSLPVYKSHLQSAESAACTIQPWDQRKRHNPGKALQYRISKVLSLSLNL